MAKKKSLKRSSGTVNSKKLSMINHRLNASAKQNRKMKGWF